MLKLRVMSALMLGGLFLVALFFLPHVSFVSLLAVIAIYAAWEWARLNIVQDIFIRFVFVGLCILFGSILHFVTDEHVKRILLFITCLYWGGVLFLLPFFQSSWIGNNRLRVFLFVTGILVIPMGWWALSELYAQGRDIFLYMMFIIWLADSAAYFSGKRFGKHSLAPELSPGKTIEGCFGALVATIALSVGAIWWFHLSASISVYFVILSVMAVLISIVGDLLESMLKRYAQVKDSGSIMPGHGGVLDRIDSLLAGAPIFALGLYWL